jgi:U-box domain
MRRVQVMIDPVLAGDGFVYERAAIEQWLVSGRKVSPMTNERLPHTYLTAQTKLRQAIEGWLRQQAGARAPAYA